MPESIRTELITLPQVTQLLTLDEGQFYDLKAKEIQPLKLSKGVSAFANTDGGDLYIGIRETYVKAAKRRARTWNGFVNEEAANGHIQTLERLFPLSNDFQYEFLRELGQPGLVLHLQVNKTQGIVRAENDIPYIRRGAQNLPVDTPEAMRRLEYTKEIVP